MTQSKSMMDNKRKVTILLAAPRGFCAGVDRAIQIVEMALEKYGAPVYVRHEIVHNKFVVDSLKAKGAVFVEELDEIPADAPGDQRPVIFSAHGVAKSVPEDAQARAMFYVDATCPLVSKVHREAERYFEAGHQIILIGHKGHPEVIGTMGQLPDGAVLLVETRADVEALCVQAPENLAYCTQTTLSVEDTADIVAALQAKFPAICGPHKEDICYATTNRQEAVKAIAPQSDAVIVIGAPNSSNSNRLVEVSSQHGCAKALLVQRASDIDWGWMEGVQTLGITAGASAPDALVDEVIEAARARFDVSIREVAITQENVNFKLPKILEQAA
ncbi:MAG: 4-hydroxy-3-methylbut-2-enyl diphosphate reductase [Rhodospirillales bacterium]|nr:4-hydroxy-3-methylbut-2-enyl diphosphate reductase [Alphaproteobacteria bacterium]USO05949.1 MAG: 4-hydroxy-3-methylbut-2-enyl diphosphate reductase [Rhodospirillales bacterium]